MTSPLFSETLDLLQQLIRNACVNDFTPGSGQEVRNADTLERFFAGEDVEIRRITPQPGRTTLVVTVPGSDPNAAPLTFMGHTDVVPVDESKWSVPPFEARIIDDKIYGRGAVDMLFITASMAVVTREMARQRPKGTLHFVALADEESRGTLGAKWISENMPAAFSWENCLSETGGAHVGDSVVLYVGEKGAAQRRLHVHGDAGHGSVPFGKDSAIAKIGRVAQRLAEAETPVSDSDIWRGFVQAFRLDPASSAALEAGAGYEKLGELAAFGHAISHLTMAQTVLRAGQAINVLPSHAYLELDIRTLPGQSDDDVDAYLRSVVGEEVEIERLICEEASISPTDSPLYRTLEEVLGEFFPEKNVVPTIAAGGSDLRFARRLGGVGYGFAVHARERSLGHTHGQLHSHDEFLYLEDLDLTLRGYEEVARRFLGA